MESNKINTYPLSKNNQQCIGPCYPKNVIINNPLTLNYAYTDENACPTLPWYSMGKVEYFAGCDDPISLDKVNEFNFNYIVPMVNFNCEYFLKTYYDIFSFEEAIIWIGNNNDPIDTKLRVMDCTWKVYGLKIDIMNDTLIEFYGIVFKKKWINKIYNKVYNFIYVNKNNISFKQNDDPPNDHKNERMKFLNEQFNTSNIIYHVLSTYIDNNKTKWDNIKNHNDAIRKHYTKYITNEIQKLIK